MANQTQVKLKSFKLNGYRLVVNGAAFNAVQKATNRVLKNANRAGHGKYEGDTIRASSRFPHGLVYTADKHAMYGEREYDTLLNSLR